jgi:hypothetical protein
MRRPLLVALVITNDCSQFTAVMDSIRAIDREDGYIIGKMSPV